MHKKEEEVIILFFESLGILLFLIFCEPIKKRFINKKVEFLFVFVFCTELVFNFVRYKDDGEACYLYVKSHKYNHLGLGELKSDQN